MGYRPWGCKESDMAERMSTQYIYIGALSKLYIHMCVYQSLGSKLFEKSKNMSISCISHNICPRIFIPYLVVELELN